MLKESSFTLFNRLFDSLSWAVHYHQTHGSPIYQWNSISLAILKRWRECEDVLVIHLWTIRKLNPQVLRWNCKSILDFSKRIDSNSWSFGEDLTAKIEVKGSRGGIWERLWWTPLWHAWGRWRSQCEFIGCLVCDHNREFVGEEPKTMQGSLRKLFIIMIIRRLISSIKSLGEGVCGVIEIKVEVD